MMAPDGIAGVVFKNAIAAFSLDRLTIGRVQNNILKQRMAWAIILLQAGRHIAEAKLAHIKIGPIEPVRVAILVRHKHFSHGDFIGNRAETLLGDVTNTVQHSAEARVKANIKLPVLPIYPPTVDGEIMALGTRQRHRAHIRARRNGPVMKLDRGDVMWRVVLASIVIGQLNNFVAFNVIKNGEAFNRAGKGAG